MYYRKRSTQRQPAPKASSVMKFDSPVAGWISNRSLSDPTDPALKSGAAVLDNFFPTATGALLRRGKTLYATLGDGDQDVTAIFSYINGNNRHLFAATDTTIYDITNVITPDNIFICTENEDLIVTDKGDFIGITSSEGNHIAMDGFTGGDWIVVQFATTGNIFLVGVNGKDEGFIYDGENFYPYIKGGVWRINIKDKTGDFPVGDTITDDRTGATGTVSESGPDYIIVRDVESEPLRWTLEYKDASPDFTIGGTIVGTDSKAYATVVEVDSSVQRTLEFYKCNKLFEVDTELTGDDSEATANIDEVTVDGEEYAIEVKEITENFKKDDTITNEDIEGVTAKFRRMENGFQFWYLNYTEGDVRFPLGVTIRGMISNATAKTVWQNNPGQLAIRDYVGAFQQDEEIRYEDISAKVSGFPDGPHVAATMYVEDVEPEGGDFEPGDRITGETRGACIVREPLEGPYQYGTLTLSEIEGIFDPGEKILGSDGAEALAKGSLGPETFHGTLTLENLSGHFNDEEEIREGTAAKGTALGPEQYESGGTFLDGDKITGEAGGEATVDGDAEQIAPGIDIPDGLTTADLDYVWVYQNRLWFNQKESLNAFYMDQPDSVGGTLVKYPMGGVYPKGGALLWGSEWSLETGLSGGLSTQMIIMSSEGDAAIYQGFNPESSDWSLVGVYKVGKPLGKRAHFKGGGDVAVATVAGLIPISKAISIDVTAMAQATVSYNIQDEWQTTVVARGRDKWVCGVWPEWKAAFVSPPLEPGNPQSIIFVSNTETGAWCRFTNWNMRAMDVFEGQLYFGGPLGQIFAANTSGYDYDSTYTGVYVPLFIDLGSPSNLKVPKLGRAVTRAKITTNYNLDFVPDFDEKYMEFPATNPTEGNAVWGEGIWGQSKWGGTLDNKITQDWKSLGGMGYACSLNYRVTSGSILPLDVQIIRLEMVYTTAEIVT